MYKKTKNIILGGAILLLSYGGAVAQVIPKDSIPKALNYIAQVANVHFLDFLSNDYIGSNKKNVDAVRQVIRTPVLTGIMSQDSLKSLMKKNDLKESYKKVAYVIYNLKYQKDLDVKDLIWDIENKLKDVNGLNFKSFSDGLSVSLAPLTKKINFTENKHPEITNNQEEQKNEVSTSTPETLLNRTGNFVRLWVMRLLMIFGLIFLVTITYKLIMKKIRKNKKRNGDLHTKKFGENPVGEAYKTRISENAGEHNYLSNVQKEFDNKKIAELEYKLNEAHLEIEELKKTLAARNEYPIFKSTIIESPKVEEPAHNHLFFASPNKDGSFPVSNQDYTLDPSFHNYQLIRKTNNPRQATIEFINNSFFISILNSPDQYIYPVFEQENAPTPVTKKISVGNPGLWELKGDKWERQSKATIKYE